MIEHKVLDKGFVRLDGALADDLSVVNSARVSFANRHEVLEEGDDKLIAFLLRNRHGTPFEHNVFRFHIKTPIFVAREWFRHRIGSFNEWSGRYSKLAPEFYVPSKENWRSQVGKPGSYTFEVVDEDVYAANSPVMEAVYQFAWDAYEKMLREGIAKEQARLVLPVSIYTQFYWTVNARSLMNFLSLRNAEAAMYEIREYAKIVEEIFANEMPITYDAFLTSGRVAP